MMTAFKAFALVLLAAGSARAARRPTPEALLLRALSAPATAYRVVERVQVFEPGRKPRALRVTRLTATDGAVRLEIPAGRSKKAAPLVFTRRAGHSALSWPARRRLWDGPVAEENAERALERLRSFYALSISTGGQAAKRRTWRVDLRDPKGRLRRSLWVDRADGLLLKSESYRLDGTLHRRRRAAKLESPAEALAQSFVLSGSEGVETFAWTRPESPAPEGRRPSAAFAPRLPRWRPDGFLLVSLTAASDGRRVSAGYGDGASSYVLTQEPAGATPAGGRVVRDGGREYVLLESDGRLQLTMLVGGRRLVITGDLPEDELARVLESVPEKP